MKDKFLLEVRKISGVKVYKNFHSRNETNFKNDVLFSYKIEIYSIMSVKAVFNVIKKHNKKYYILGKGSNVLFANNVCDCVLLKLMPMSNDLNNIVYAGDALNYINSKYLEKGIASLNFLSGVPCSIGGSIYMNAGAFGQSISDVIEYVYVFDIDKMSYGVLNNEECMFRYRESYFKKSNILILGAKIKLLYEDKEELLKEHHRFLEIRKHKLPLDYPNLGSIFKNPTGMYAGKIIEDLGLKGFIVGGSKISDKHANVIINYADASGNDVMKLIDIIKQEVYMKYKIELELEINVFK